MPGYTLSFYIGFYFGGDVFKKKATNRFNQYNWTDRVWSRKKGRWSHSSNLVRCIIWWYNSTLFKDAIYKKQSHMLTISFKPHHKPQQYFWEHGHNSYSVSLNDTLQNDTKLINPQGILAFPYSFSSGVTSVRNKVETQVACEQSSSHCFATVYPIPQRRLTPIQFNLRIIQTKHIFRSDGFF